MELTVLVLMNAPWRLRLEQHPMRHPSRSQGASMAQYMNPKRTPALHNNREMFGGEET